MAGVSAPAGWDMASRPPAAPLRQTMNILGISAFYHDSAACLLRDGVIVAAAQEERFSRRKHDPGFPEQAIAFCLRQGELGATALDAVAFYDKPILKFERILQTHLGVAPAGLPAFVKAVPLWLKEKLWIRDRIQSSLSYPGPILFPEHHESHAAAAFFPSPYDEAAILTMDGVGEWATTSLGVGSGKGPAAPRHRVPALSRAALQRVHAILRVPHQRRRVQADGAGALWQTHVRPPHPR